MSQSAGMEFMKTPTDGVEWNEDFKQTSDNN